MVDSDGHPCRCDSSRAARARCRRLIAVGRAAAVGSSPQRTRHATARRRCAPLRDRPHCKRSVGSRIRGAIVVGSKNFTEQIILGEIVAQAIERETGLSVDRRLNLGGTLICDRALLNGDIDVYVEYTGTALTAIFKQPVANDAGTVFDDGARAYARSGRTLLPAAWLQQHVRHSRAQPRRAEKGLRTIDDLAREAPRWRAGFGYEFLERPDGFPGLARTYGLRFAEPPHVMDLSLSYRALAVRPGGRHCRRRDRGFDQRARPLPPRGQSPVFPALRRDASGARGNAAAISGNASGADSASRARFRRRTCRR